MSSNILCVDVGPQYGFVCHSLMKGHPIEIVLCRFYVF